jgi:hypothetical protein
MESNVLSQVDRFTEILNQYSPNRNEDWNKVDLSGIQNVYDRKYVDELIRTLRSLDPGNKHLALGRNLQTPVWAFWLINFKGAFTETHFRIIRSINHPVQGWIPIKENGVTVKDNPDFGTCLWVWVTPLPQNSMMLTAPEPQFALPAPAPVFRAPAVDYTSHEPRQLYQQPPPPEQKKQKNRDSSPKRGMFGGVVRLLVGPKKSSESSSD